MVPMCCSKCEEKVKEELESMEGNELTSHDQIMYAMM
jgi:copper chaperone CopZ